MRVEKRIVSRWFLDGKGYASETAAYLAWAKRELNLEILDVAIPEMIGSDSKEKIHAEFVRRFPPCNYPGCEDCHPSFRGHPRAFCNRSRWEWLRAKAKELRDADA